ncbi:MAG TPA: prolyl oligopeptidase family serine peptidase [Woeseiaceae bacterium]|jgi:dienelactone hydrolase|nr:prolyl oligopeptidase family serine peptidase [Woeseiaceae bacterium]
MIRVVLKLLKYAVIAIVFVLVMSLAWLRWESHQPRTEYWQERHGQLIAIASEESTTPHGQLTETLTLGSDSGLQVLVRVIRDRQTNRRLPVLIVLGGHRTGSDAVDLFGYVGERVVIGIDYPYYGPEKVKGVRQTLSTIPLARQAFLDTVPAVSLVLDWIVGQPWADTDRVVVVGASLGVPFAAAAAARDQRIKGAVLVHGAADNRLWIEAQVARRIDTGFMHYPLSVVLHWLAYGPSLDTGQHIARITPRPVVIIGALRDERTPAGQTELLYKLAGEPKRLRFTDSAHVEPDRPEIVAALLRMADEEMVFLTGGQGPQ